MTEKNQGEHFYKGNYQGDYFLTVRYDDDPTHLWVKSVRGETYFAVTVNTRYLERNDKCMIYIIVLFLVLMVFGLFLFFDGLD